MPAYLLLAGFLAAYLGCGAGALWLGQASRKKTDRATRDGTRGENRVARVLSQAGYTVLSDLTLSQGSGTHQIDHVVCGRDQLYILETKTWRGIVEGRAGGQHWILRRPMGRPPMSIYNPLIQNRTHAQVIGALTRVPVTPLVVSAANIKVPPDLAADVVPLAGLAAHLGPPGPAESRIQAAFDVLVRRKASWSQKRLSERHRRWMTYNRRFDPVRALWVACAVSLACALFTAQRVFGG